MGSYVSRWFDPDILKAILGMGLLAIAYSLLRSPTVEVVKLLNENATKDKDAESSGGTRLVAADGEVFNYKVCGKWLGMVTASVGGFFTGMISTGLGELNSYFLLEKCKVPARVAVATSVFTVALTALSAATGHAIHIFQSGPDVLKQVFSFVIFTIPGVLVGGQIGPALSSRVSQHVLEKSLGILFILVSILTLGQLLLSR